MNIFKRKPRLEITDRSNVIQRDAMGYPLRLVILGEEQIWLDTCEEEGDVELKWKGSCQQEKPEGVMNE